MAMSAVLTSQKAWHGIILEGAQVMANEETLLKAGEVYPVWSPYDSFGAAALLMEVLARDADDLTKPVEERARHNTELGIGLEETWHGIT
jgi:hypothetical protein